MNKQLSLKDRQKIGGKRNLCPFQTKNTQFSQHVERGWATFVVKVFAPKHSALSWSHDVFPVSIELNYPLRQVMCSAVTDSCEHARNLMHKNNADWIVEVLPEPDQMCKLWACGPHKEVLGNFYPLLWFNYGDTN